MEDVAGASEPGRLEKAAAFARLAVARQGARTEHEWTIAARDALAAIERGDLGRLKRLRRQHGPDLAGAAWRKDSVQSPATSCATLGRPDCLAVLLEGVDLSGAAWRERPSLLLAAVSSAQSECARIAIEAGDDVAVFQLGMGDVFWIWAKALVAPVPGRPEQSAKMLEILLDASAKKPQKGAWELFSSALIALNGDVRGTEAEPTTTEARVVFGQGMHKTLAKKAPDWILERLVGMPDAHPDVRRALQVELATRGAVAIRGALDSDATRLADEAAAEKAPGASQSAQSVAKGRRL
jgi:hypothetical protein